MDECDNKIVDYGKFVEDMRSVLNVDLSEFSYVFIISRKWFESMVITITESNTLIPIDNSDILSGKEGIHLREDITFDDFFYISGDTWIKIFNFCKIVPNQYPIRRRVFNDETRRKIDMFPPMVCAHVIELVESAVFFPAYFDMNINEIILNVLENMVKMHANQNFEFSNLLFEIFYDAEEDNKVVPIEVNPQLTVNDILIFANNFFGTYSSVTLPILKLVIRVKSLLFVPGVVGLQNLGNTCYMNSALQCLSNVDDLTRYFLEERHLRELNVLNPLGAAGRIALAYGNLIKDMWGKIDSRILSPLRLKQNIGMFSSMFIGYQQHDSQELLSTLLDALHEDLNRIKDKPYISLPDFDNNNVEYSADLSWDAFRKRNDSIIVDLFYGQLKSTIQCPQCDKVSVTFDPFNCISLSLSNIEDIKIIISVTPFDITENVQLYKFKTSKGCSLEDVIDHFIKKTTKKHRNYFVLTKNVKFLFTLDQFIKASKDILRSSYVKFDLFEYIPHTNPLDELKRTYFVIKHKIIYERSAKYFPNPVLLFVEETIDDMIEEFPIQSIKTELNNRLNTFLKANSDSILQNGQSGSSFSTISISDADENLYELKSVPPLLSDYKEHIDLIQDPNVKYATLFVAEWSPESSRKMFSNFVPYISHSAVSQENQSSWEYISSSGSSAVSDDSLESCLKVFSSGEVLSENNSWYCSNCKVHQKAFKKLELYRLPKYLILHFKRFSFSRILSGKISKLINFPQDELDMSKYAIKSDDMMKYSLFAVSNHMGSLNGGHYTAYAKNPFSDEWFHFNDSIVSKCANVNPVTSNAYIIMYKRSS